MGTHLRRQPDTTNAVHRAELPTGFCNKDKPQVGIIAITKEPGEDKDTPAIGQQISLLYSVILPPTAARLWCAFTTASMAVAYASSFDTKPKVPSRDSAWSSQMLKSHDRR
jgi:hypothetical protein